MDHTSLLTESRQYYWPTKVALSKMVGNQDSNVLSLFLQQKYLLVRDWDCQYPTLASDFPTSANYCMIMCSVLLVCSIIT